MPGLQPFILTAIGDTTMYFGLPFGAWLLVLGSIIPAILLTAYYTHKSKTIDAKRAKAGGDS
jgi:putative solute:sodium symporter small subunit